MSNYNELAAAIEEFFSAKVIEEINLTLRKNYPKKFSYGEFQPLLHSTFSQWIFDSKKDRLIIAANGFDVEKDKDPAILSSLIKKLDEFNLPEDEKIVFMASKYGRTTRIIFTDWRW